jgi:S1-C subfamily serine protease
MKLKSVFSIIAPIIFFSLMLSCSTEKITSTQQIYNDGEYDTQFPSKEASEFISEIGKSIKLINSLVFYKLYSFDYSQAINPNNGINDATLRSAKSESNSNTSSSGTATIVAIGRDKILLLTTAHIINFRDTIYTYFSDSKGQPTNYIESVAIKQSQSIYIGEIGISELKVVLADEKKDIAFLEGVFDYKFINKNSVFSYKIGNSSELEWGDFVYVFGYPMHYQLLTRGIVSIVESSEDYFLVDVNVNRGSSGGIVLALRDGIPNFELVGMVSWVPAERKKILVPKTLYNNKTYQLDAQYRGDVFISELENVRYGITRVISIQSVIDLLEKNDGKLVKNDYDISSFKSLKGNN